MISFKCPWCSQLLKVSDGLAGKPVKCAACKQETRVPAGGQAVPAGSAPASDAGIAGKLMGFARPGTPAMKWVVRGSVGAVLLGGVVVLVMIGISLIPEGSEGRPGAKELKKYPLPVAAAPSMPAESPKPVAVPVPVAPAPVPAPAAVPEVAPTRPERVRLAKGLRDGIRDRLNSVPGYSAFIPSAEASRLEKLLAAESGTRDDLAFLQVRIASRLLPAFEKDFKAVETRLAELRSAIPTSEWTDVVRFKDGGSVQGRVEKESGDALTLSTPFGKLVSPRSSIEGVDRGDGAKAEFPLKHKAAQGKLEALVELLAWCKDQGLKPHAEYVAASILVLRPDHAPSRATLGLRPVPVP